MGTIAPVTASTSFVELWNSWAKKNIKYQHVNTDGGKGSIVDSATMEKPITRVGSPLTSFIVKADRATVEDFLVWANKGFFVSDVPVDEPVRLYQFSGEFLRNTEYKGYHIILSTPVGTLDENKDYVEKVWGKNVSF